MTAFEDALGFTQSALTPFKTTTTFLEREKKELFPKKSQKS